MFATPLCHYLFVKYSISIGDGQQQGIAVISINLRFQKLIGAMLSTFFLFWHSKKATS